MSWVTLAAIIAALLSGIALYLQLSTRNRTISLLTIAVFVLAVTIALVGLHVLPSGDIGA